MDERCIAKVGSLEGGLGTLLLENVTENMEEDDRCIARVGSLEGV